MPQRLVIQRKTIKRKVVRPLNHQWTIAITLPPGIDEDRANHVMRQLDALAESYCVDEVEDSGITIKAELQE